MNFLCVLRDSVVKKLVMKNEIEKWFIKKRIGETRCPELIANTGIKNEIIYLLRERIECGEWKHVSKFFVPVKGKYILTEPVSARRFFTIEPEKVISAMKTKNLW